MSEEFSKEGLAWLVGISGMVFAWRVPHLWGEVHNYGLSCGYRWLSNPCI